jgi:hypothetical protein
MSAGSGGVAATRAAVTGAPGGDVVYPTASPSPGTTITPTVQTTPENVGR